MISTKESVVMMLLYLNKQDDKVLSEANMLLESLWKAGKIDPEDEHILIAFDKLLWQSNDYSVECRDRAKKKVQKMRKIDKTYAHTKNKKERSDTSGKAH